MISKRTTDTDERIWRIGSNEVELMKVLEQIEILSQKRGAPDRLLFKIQHAVWEVMENARKHGERGGDETEKVIKVIASFYQRSIEVVIQDQGNGYSQEHVRELTDDMPNGRGTAMIETMADRVRYSRKRTTVELTFYLTRLDRVLHRILRYVSNTCPNFRRFTSR